MRSSPDVPPTQYTLHNGLLTCSFLLSDEISIHYEYLEYVCVLANRKYKLYIYCSLHINIELILKVTIYIYIITAAICMN